MSRQGLEPHSGKSFWTGVWTSSSTSCYSIEMLLLSSQVHRPPIPALLMQLKDPWSLPQGWGSFGMAKPRLPLLLNILNVILVEPLGSLPQPVWAFVSTHLGLLSSEMPSAQRIRVKPASLRSVSSASGRIIASPRTLGKQPLLIF
jgi:hypothetical protein